VGIDGDSTVVLLITEGRLQTLPASKRADARRDTSDEDRVLSVVTSVADQGLKPSRCVASLAAAVQLAGQVVV